MTATEILVTFRATPRDTFMEQRLTSAGHLRFRLSPDVSISLGLRVKKPGERMVGRDVELMLTEQPGSIRSPYQRLLSDAMRGNSDLFGRQDIIDAQWRVVDPVLYNAPACGIYERGSWGPSEAIDLIGHDGPWCNPQSKA